VRLLVIGGSGLVGSHVLREARARLGGGHTAIGTYRANPLPSDPTMEPLDGGRIEDFEKLLEKHRPDAVVHAAGWTWVDGCEDDPARALEENCSQPVRMATLCAARAIRFVYFSTSYVFDGSAGPYDESSATGPDQNLGLYALSKLEAERKLAEATDGQALIARVICVFGEESRRKNFAYQVVDAMRQGKTLKLPSDQRGNPTWAGDIARTLVTLLETGESGIWHLGGPDPDCDRVEWARRLIAAFTAIGVKTHPDFHIVGIPTAELGQRAPRPLHAGMVSRRLKTPVLATAIEDDVYRRIAAE
jgi:dTDP-4-dehydrorhamnose reductase